MLTAGFSKVCISPPIGAPLAGFAARQGVSEGIHDDLFARALVLANGEAVVALVSVDLLALSGDFIKRVREAIQRRTSIDPSSVMIASTHTHAGPVTITTFFNPEESVDSAYMDSLAEPSSKASPMPGGLGFRPELASVWRKLTESGSIVAAPIRGRSMNRSALSRLMMPMAALARSSSTTLAIQPCWGRIISWSPETFPISRSNT